MIGWKMWELYKQPKYILEVNAQSRIFPEKKWDRKFYGILIWLGFLVLCHINLSGLSNVKAILVVEH